MPGVLRTVSHRLWCKIVRKTTEPRQGDACRPTQRDGTIPGQFPNTRGWGLLAFRRGTIEIIDVPYILGLWPAAGDGG